MKENHEVEYRALINSEIFSALLNKGKQSKYFQGPLIIRDDYFCPRSVKNFKEIEMDKVGSYSLRLREETRCDNAVSTMNVKIIRKNGDHNAWLEHEVIVSSRDECEKILESIGFKKFFKLVKKRYFFSDKGINIFLEDIEEFQPAIEVEIITSEDKIDKAKDKLLKYFDQNNIQRDAIVKKSITNMLMRQRSVF